MPKTKLSRVEVRMTPEEKENLKRKATEAHMTVSKYIIHLSQTKRVILKEDIAKLTVEISRIGNNINQIAYIGNYQIRSHTSGTIRSLSTEHSLKLYRNI